MIRPIARPWLAAWLAGTLLLASPQDRLPAHEPDVSPVGSGERTFLRGMVVSCPTYGPIWGSPQMSTALNRLKGLGVEWAAIHPYARVGRDGGVRFQPAASTGFLERAVEIAREQGVRLFWKPHLAYWESFAWRGAIQFGDDETAWRRFFDGYREFILDQARFADRSGIELLAIGVETEGTTHRESEWRSLIADVRRVFRGRLTYAANWDALDRVPFWDAVDLIGVHAYFPLSPGPDAERAELLEAWRSHLARLQALSRRHRDKPILFAEIGYSRSPEAASRPWEAGLLDTPEVRSSRARLMEAALSAVEGAPFVQGLFWWKWIPGDDRHDRDFSMKDPESVAVLARAWGPPPSAKAAQPPKTTGD